MEEASFKTYVKGIYCAQCPEMILSGLLQTRGVIDADVAYFQAQVRVAYDPEIISDAEIRCVLEELGYPPVERKPLLSERITEKLAYLLRGQNGSRGI